ncbi:MAG: MIP/aquaporin family protein [Cetobacterium sp.]|uniref:MIP/aquaporin family protein n=1 Tax=unclassified Cetobacterium TaxID=2630983 RepID=UPI00064663E3|nr:MULTISPECIES: MIP/aquaporin family protein [unclassified Cetobacterium]
MNVFVAEFIGTAILVLLGNGVVANVVLNKTKGNNSGWIVITTAWGLAVMAGAYAVGWVSGGHLNPALTIGFAIAGLFPKNLVLGYVIAQILGAMLGQLLVFLTYKRHYDETSDAGSILASFSTGPAIRDLKWNFITEIIATFMLVFGLLAIGHINNQAFTATLPNGELIKGFTGIVGPLLAGFYIWSLGLSLGGPTGYSLNPARDLGPRIIHAILPIANKGDSDWGYSWVPVAGPIVGGIIGALTFVAVFN